MAISASTKIVPILIAVAAVVILVIALVASSLRKLNSDQREFNLKLNNINFIVHEFYSFLFLCSWFTV